MRTESIRPTGASGTSPAYGKTRTANKKTSTPADAAQNAGVCLDLESGHPVINDADKPAQKAGDAKTDTAKDAVEPRMAAVYAFAETYNALTGALACGVTPDGGATPDAERERLYKHISDALRAAAYQPVELETSSMRTRFVSLYEIGVAHSPDSREAGRLTVHGEKLRAALLKRERDVSALLSHTGDSLPVRFQSLLSPFLEIADSDGIRAYCDSFLQACVRLSDLFKS